MACVAIKRSGSLAGYTSFRAGDFRNSALFVPSLFYPIFVDEVLVLPCRLLSLFVVRGKATMFRRLLLPSLLAVCI